MGLCLAELTTSPSTDPPATSECGIVICVGQTIGHYRLLYPLAPSSIAGPWAAKPEIEGALPTVALKLVRLKQASEEKVRMFIDQALWLSSISHPNVCAIHELGRKDDVLFMAIEWVPGDSLREILCPDVKPTPLAFDVAARIVAEACAGLHAVHDAVGSDQQPLGIVHRDVSQSTILISVEGDVKVTGFGAATARRQLYSRTRRAETHVKSTNVAPEQILGKGVDRRTDVYAMGCVLYEASLGRSPFDRSRGAFDTIVQGKFASPRALRPDYPQALESIVVKALATNPRKRYRTIYEMGFALEKWLLTRPQPIARADLSRAVRERMKPARLRRIASTLSA